MTSPYRNPDGLFFQLSSTRWTILACYCALIISAIPLWWKTTSIERQALNVDVETLQPLRLPVFIRAPGAPRLQEALRKEILQNPAHWEGIDVHVNDGKAAESYIIEESNGPIEIYGRKLLYPLSTTPETQLVDILSSLLVPYSRVQDKKHTVAQFSPRYRLSFSLLNEDAAEGGPVDDWEVEQAISKNISPILKDLSALHNFTIESQVQLHAPLAVQSRPLADGCYGLTPEDLTVFVNSAEWTLSSSSSNDPVLHFVLFIPAKTRRPLHILDVNGRPSQSRSFLLPQWGGIIIADPPATSTLSLEFLKVPFGSFRSQLLTLLGVPNLPSSVSQRQSSGALTDWQLDALLRKRLLENTVNSQNTLKSIVRLVDQIENMPVGERVRRDVDASLSALRELRLDSTLIENFRHSADALVSASCAFFSPGMLAMLYFPAEHKYAVYTPLFASALIPVLGAVVREISSWRKQQRAALQNDGQH